MLKTRAAKLATPSVVDSYVVVDPLCTLKDKALRGAGYHLVLVVVAVWPDLLLVGSLQVKEELLCSVLFFMITCEGIVTAFKSTLKCSLDKIQLW